MQDFILMHMMHCLEQVLDDKGCCFLSEVFILRDDIVQLPITTQLHQGIKVHLIMKKTV